MTLSKLKHGDRAVITAIDTADSAAIGKLAARGIVPGTRIGVLRTGDPLLIGIDNDRWAINRSEATSIHVDILESPPFRLRNLFRRS